MQNQILLVDDDDDLLETFKESLEIRGYEVITAHDGKDAIKQYDEHEPCITFMDIKMPIMDGYESFSKIKDKHNDTKVVFVTGHQNISKSKIAIRDGLLKILNKPISNKDVMSIIKEYDC